MDLSFSAQWRGLPPVIAATWTLVIEITFYFIVAMILFLRNILKGLSIEISFQAILLAFYVLSILSVPSSFSPPFNLINLGGYAQVFLAGAITHFLVIEKNRMTFLAKIYIVVFIYSGVYLNLVARMSGGKYAQQISLFLVIVLFWVSMSSRRDNIKSSPILNLIPVLGTATYTFYLLHQQIGLFLSTWLHAKAGLSLIISSVLALTALVFLSVAIERINIQYWNRRSGFQREPEIIHRGNV